MKVGLGQLWSLLQDNVAEVKFTRRKPKPGDSLHRRMLCTNSQALLNSNDGRLTLNFVPPKHYPQYDPKTKNLIVTWDIFMQAFRTINVDQCDLISVIPSNELFWEYFRDNLSGMNQTDKTNFMNQ
jgi:hypothetical protein